jgi:pimeloyl-ACP methyl ester carboxylesterase
MQRALNYLNPDDHKDIVWDYDKIHSKIAPAITQVVEQFNQAAFDDLFSEAASSMHKDQETGIEFVHIGREGASTSQAIVHFNPFLTSLDANMLMRASFLQKSLQALGLKDDDRNAISLVGFAAANADSSLKLTRKHRKPASRGDFGVLAREYVYVVQRLGYKSLYIVGYSQGATMAAAVAVEALRVGLEVSHVAIGEPANVLRRRRTKLGRDFLAADDFLNKAIDDSGIEHMKRFYFNVSPSFVLSMRRSVRTNLSIASGLAKDTLKHDLAALAATQTKVTIAYGTLNKVCPKAAIEKIVNASRELPGAKGIYSVEVLNAHHAWGDRLNLLALFYAYGLSR